MGNQDFNYEEGFMGVRESKPKTYKLSFREDYRLRSLVKTMRISKGNLLDIGCGGGRFTESVPYYFPKINMYGCDVSSAAISYARKLGSGKVKYDVIKNGKLPYKNNFFDVCICLDVLEHVSNVNFFLSEVKRVLKKDGKFFLIVPCEGEKLTYTWLFQKIHLGEDLTYRYMGHIHPEFTHKSVVNLLKNNGFKTQNVGYSEHTPYQLMHLFVYFLPKAILELFLGKEKTEEYTNSSLISSPKSERSSLMLIRRLWFKFFDFMMMYPMYWETVILRRIPSTAWKIHLLASIRKTQDHLTTSE